MGVYLSIFECGPQDNAQSQALLLGLMLNLLLAAALKYTKVGSELFVLAVREAAAAAGAAAAAAAAACMLFSATILFRYRNVIKGKTNQIACYGFLERELRCYLHEGV